MARMNVFNRNDNSTTPIPRSLQYLNHRHTTTLPYGQITPIFCEQILPHETLRLNVTNFLRSIPMKTPQLSRVRVVTRFYAIENRTMWFPFEEWIDGVKDSKFAIDPPCIINFDSIVKEKIVQSGTGRPPVIISDVNSIRYDSKPSLAAAAAFEFLGYATDLSFTGVGVTNEHFWHGSISAVAFYRWRRNVSLSTRGATFVEPNGSDLKGYQFFPHELGDYLNCPVYTPSLYSDKTGRISAFPFCAYQLACSYGYRKPNVQDRTDDFYEMNKVNKNRYFPEFNSYFLNMNTDTGQTEPPISTALSALANGDLYESELRVVNGSAFSESDGDTYAPDRYGDVTVDWSADSNPDSVVATSWECVEHFPLKNGANLVMHAMDYDGDFGDGMPRLVPSRISLTRLRYAPWFADRFIEANPWQQRGLEALIPVGGTASITLDGIEFIGTPATITPAGTVAIQSKYPVVEGGNYLRVQTDVVNNTEGPSDDPTHFAIEPVINYSGSSISGGGTLNSSGVSLYNPNLESASIPYSRSGLMVNLNTVETSFTGSPVSYTPAGTVSGTGSADVSGLYVLPSQFRFAMQLQKLKEMSARTDGRYKSFLSMFYGSKSRDARLDRPQFIGGMVQELNMSEITQTAPTDGQPLGTLAGRGVSGKKSYQISFHAFEHAIVIGLVHIMPDSEYIGGLDRQKNITSPFDYAMPQFAGLSEQPIKMKELCFMPSSLTDTDQPANEVVFGYEPRFNELRVKHSYATGAFRDVLNTTGSYAYFNAWLITRKFGYDVRVKAVAYIDPSSLTPTYGCAGFTYVTPTLSGEFISSRNSVDYSNFEVQNLDVMYPFMLDSYFDIRFTRVIPSRGIPRI